MSAICDRTGVSIAQCPCPLCQRVRALAYEHAQQQVGHRQTVYAEVLPPEGLPYGNPQWGMQPAQPQYPPPVPRTPPGHSNAPAASNEDHDFAAGMIFGGFAVAALIAFFSRR